MRPFSVNGQQYVCTFLRFRVVCIQFLPGYPGRSDRPGFPGRLGRFLIIWMFFIPLCSIPTRISWKEQPTWIARKVGTRLLNSPPTSQSPCVQFQPGYPGRSGRPGFPGRLEYVYLITMLPFPRVWFRPGYPGRNDRPGFPGRLGCVYSITMLPFPRVWFRPGYPGRSNRPGFPGRLGCIYLIIYNTPCSPAFDSDQDILEGVTDLDF